MNLTDKWNESGKTIDGFRNVCRNIAEATKMIKCKGYKMTMLINCLIPKLQFPDKTTVYVVNQEDIENLSETNRIEHCGTLPYSVYSKELCDEMKSGTKMLACVDDNTYFISTKAIASLGRWIGYTGADINRNGMSFIDALCFARKVFMKEDYLKLVYREDDNKKKIFGAFGTKYVIIPMTYLSDLFDNIKGLEMVKWESTHETTEFIADVGDGKARPAIRVVGSNIGVCSWTFQAVLRHGSDYVVIDEETCENSKKLTYINMELAARKMIKVAKETAKAIESIATPIMDYTAKNDFFEENFKRIDFLTGTIIDSLPVGKKWKTSLKATMEDDIDCSRQYTYKDLFIFAMRIPEKIEEANPYTIECVRKALSTSAIFLAEESKKIA